jgi:hypothetical protein
VMMPRGRPRRTAVSKSKPVRLMLCYGGCGGWIMSNAVDQTFCGSCEQRRINNGETGTNGVPYPLPND